MGSGSLLKMLQIAVLKGMLPFFPDFPGSISRIDSQSSVVVNCPSARAR
jgi:hypothetical protein